MFHSTLTTDSSQDEPLVEVPISELESGPLAEGETYRIAVLGTVDNTNSSNPVSETPANQFTEAPAGSKGSPEYPVNEGEQLEVVIEDMGDEGDGIAKVNGYAVIVPDATVGQEVFVEINRTTSTHAFATPIETHPTTSD